MHKIIKLLLAIVVATCIVFVAIPAVMYQIINVGVIILSVLAVLCTVQILLLRGCKQRPWEIFANKGRVLIVARRLLGTLLVFIAVGITVLSVIMLRPTLAGGTTAGNGATAVVLGCGIKQDKPMLMLQRRLEQALIYLNANPESYVVVTGGMDDRYSYTEAYVQQKWLMERGIAEERIIIEDKSHDTMENLQNTVALLVENELPNDMMLFTDTFHQLRSQQYARLAVALAADVDYETRRTLFFDTAVGGQGSNTPWGLVPCYWLREQAAIAEAIFMSPVGSMYIG